MLAVLVSIANIVWTWHTRSQSAAADRVQKIEIRLDLVEDKQVVVEERLKHLPTKEDIGAIALGLERVLGKVDRQDSQITSMQRGVDRIENYMREKA